ncbi:MAG: metal ABC transporter permease [Deltaproteobacteria bacterium]|nr:metal ABC transporter permease [Deltaproteobacteria bacterium]
MTAETLLLPLYAAIGRMLPFAFAEPLFMKRAILATLLVAPTAAAVGVPLVQFRMAFFSDAIGHSAFTGIALGVLLGIHPLGTMVAFGLFVAYAITLVKGRTELSPDTVIGVFFSTVVALGIAIISAQKGLTRNLQAYLYGDLLAVSDAEVLWMGALAGGVGTYLYLAFNRIMLLSANEGLARTLGVRARAVEASFCLVVALVVTTAIRAVGILLVTALLVIPAATARNVARGTVEAFWIAVATALLSGLLGTAASFSLDTATGATIVLFAAAFFAVSAAAGPLRGRAV